MRWLVSLGAWAGAIIAISVVLAGFWRLFRRSQRAISELASHEDRIEVLEEEVYGPDGPPHSPHSPHRRDKSDGSGEAAG